MCRDHGKGIDSTDPKSTVERLREWKKQAEKTSRGSVLRNKASRGQQSPRGRATGGEYSGRRRSRLKVFREIAKWPSTSVALALEVEGFVESVTTNAHAGAVMSLDDLILVAPRGMCNTTALFQIAEGVLSSKTQIAVAVRGDAGAKIVAKAWRTACVRELVTIPISLSDGAAPAPSWGHRKILRPAGTPRRHVG